VDLAGDFVGATYFAGYLAGVPYFAGAPYFARDLVEKHLY
jgi:hypothetical protein